MQREVNIAMTESFGSFSGGSYIKKNEAEIPIVNSSIVENVQMNTRKIILTTYKNFFQVNFFFEEELKYYLFMEKKIEKRLIIVNV